MCIVRAQRLHFYLRPRPSSSSTHIVEALQAFDQYKRALAEDMAEEDVAKDEMGTKRSKNTRKMSGKREHNVLLFTPQHTHGEIDILIQQWKKNYEAHHVST